MDFWVDIEKDLNNDAIIPRGKKVKISGTVRNREKDGSMWSNAPACPNVELYIVLQSECMKSSNKLVLGVWTLYREMVWIKADENGKFSFEINTKQLPVLRDDSMGAGRHKDKFMSASEYKIGYSDDPGLKNMEFTSAKLLIIEPSVLACFKKEIGKFLLK